MNLINKIKLKTQLEFSKRLTLEDFLYLLKQKKTAKSLNINGKEFPYLFHSYNNMGLTERSVEIPIIYFYLTEKKYNNILEVGNVTNFYEDYFFGAFPNKTVVDKLEENYNVITSDIAKYKGERKFDFIFSISTFEHMDSDLGRNPEYIPNSSKSCSIAADNIIYCYEQLLEEGGVMVITAPLGYTPEWDITFKSNCLDNYGFKKINKIVFKRVNEQEWEELKTYDGNGTYEYGKPYPYANYVSIFEIRK